jgi:hypothetical protein
MPVAPYRIVVSGPVGSGKSTLVAALAERLGLRPIEEKMAPLYRTRAALIQSSKPPVAPVAEQVALRDAWLQSFFDWCADRAGEYRAASETGFVADRWEMDLLGNWLRIFSAHRPAPQDLLDRKGRELMALATERAHHIDLAILLPVADGFEKSNEAGLVRAADFASQVLSYQTSLGLMQTLPPNVLRYAPPAVEPVDKRLADILDLLGAS